MATIRDVARAAGVSIATVSRVWTGSHHVSQATSRKVLAAAAKMDYWPSAAARSLTTNRTHTVGVLLPDLFGEFFSEVIRGIDQAAQRDNYQVLVSSSHASTEDLLAAARTMRGRVDGLIVMAPDEAFIPVLRQIGRAFDLVLLSAHPGAGAAGTFSVANVEGALAATAHLVRRGHRVIATVRGPLHNRDAEDRLAGYRTALRGGDIEPKDTLEYQGDFTEASGFRCGQEILRRRPRPTAVFAANDSMAIGVISAFREGGLRVPDDIAVVGFDDISVSRYLNPPLTTVHVDPFELGFRSMRRWLQRQNGAGEAAEDTPAHEVLPATLVVRGTCGAPIGTTGKPGRAGGSRSRLHPQQGGTP